MFNQLRIKEDQVYLQNNINIVKALTDALLPQFGCFAHTLMLVVHYGSAVIDSSD